MVDTDLREGRRKLSGVSRRRFVKAAGASGVAVGLAGCISSTDNGGDGTGTDGGSGGTDSGNGEQIDTSAPSEDVTVQWAADSRAADNADALKQALHDAGLPDNITVEILSGSQVTDNRQSQYQTWLNGGREEPALLMMDSGWTIPFIAREQIQNLSAALPDSWISEIEDTYFQASVQTAKSPESGDLYAIPLFPDFPTVQYRKDLVEQAGYDPEGENWATESMQWQEFSAMIADVKQQNDLDYGFNFQASVYEGLSCCDFNEFMTSWGGAYFGSHDNLFGPVGDRPITVDEEAVLQSIRMIRSFIHGEGPDEHGLEGYEDISPNAVLQWVEDPSMAPFANGSAVALRNWPYSIVQNGSEEYFGENLGVMPIPYGVTQEEAQYEGTGGPVAALGGWHITMNPNSQKKQAAAQVMRAMMSEDFQLQMFEVMGWIPPRPELLQSDRASQVPVIGRYVDQLRVAGENAVPRPVTVVWPQESDRISREVNAAYAQDKTPEKAMSDLKGALQQIEQST